MSVESPDDLYGLPLADFTAARNKLAKETGDKSIAKLRKPSAAAWALDQAARERKGDVARFLHAAASVRATASRAALDDLRQAEADVRRAALGFTADNQLGAVNELLSAAAVDEAVGDLLRRGVLTGAEQPEASPFLATGPPPAADELGRVRKEKAASAAKHPSRRTQDDAAAAREAARREKARQKAADAAEAAKELDHEAERLAREAADLEDKAAKARRRAEAARAKADDAKAKAAALHEAARA